MSNKLLSMLEMASMGFPQNEFYALDLRGVKVEEIEGFLQDGLRNFKAKVNCRSILIRTGMAGKPEAKLYLGKISDANDNELIINKMKEALAFLSKRFNGYGNGFIIIQEWTPEEEYRYSLNLMPTSESLIVEAVKGNHTNLDRKEEPPTILKIKPTGITTLKQTLSHNELLDLNRLLKQLVNQFIFKENNVYELSLLNDRASFYQIKEPGKLYKNPISKDDFYKKLRDNNIKFKNRIMRKNL